MRNSALFASVSGMIMALAASVASAQTATDGVQPGSVGEVVVTGSRVARVGFVAPTPVTAVSVDQLKVGNPGSISDALRQLPSLSASTGPRGSNGSGGTGGSFLNLRRLGAPRTLTLLDGRRFVPSGSNSTVDTALFPQALVSRVEVVTGGASAAYGSDAVAGVVNFILDKNFTGVKGEIVGGISSRNDSREATASLAYGSDFASRGHVLLSGEVYTNEGVYDLLKRPNYRKSCAVIANPSGPTARSFACDVRASNANFGGLISTGPLRGTTFDPNGNAIPFNFGTNASSATQVGGDGPLIQFLPLAVPADRAVLFGRATWDFNDSVTGFVEANYGATRYVYQIGSYSLALGSTALTVFSDNAYLTPQFRQSLVTRNIANFRLGLYDRNLPRTLISNINDTTRIVGGLEGRFKDWKWQAYAEHGENRQGLDAEYDLLLENYQRASDAVFNSAGQIVCRSSLTDPRNGCTPINVIGEHSRSAAALAYVTGTNYTTAKTIQNSAAFNIDGEPFSVPAGAVSLAVGGEYRKQSVSSVADPRSMEYNALTNANGPYRAGNYLPQRGSYDVYEAFAETVVPILKGLPFVEELDFNGAARRTHYSTSGSVTTWKAGLSYKPNSVVRFRATKSRDIRAPNLSELFNAGSTGHITLLLDQFYNPPRTTSNVLNITRGNPNLKPEVADTFTAGVVISPPFVPGLDISIDGYDIEISGAIAIVDPQRQTLDCRNGSASACTAVDRDAAGNVTTAYTLPVNLQVLKSSGIDFEASYRINLAEYPLALPGKLDLRFLGNYVKEAYTVAPGAVIVDRTGDSSQPSWRWTATAAYRNGPIAVSGQARYSGSGPYDSTTIATDLPQLKIGGQVLIDGRVSYDIETNAGDYTVFVSAQNITDKLPPDFTPFGGEHFDPIGRYFRVGLSFKH